MGEFVFWAVDLHLKFMDRFFISQQSGTTFASGWLLSNYRANLILSANVVAKESTRN